MTPAERTAKWREDHPSTSDEADQRRVIEGWASGASPCPWVIDRSTWRIASRRNGAIQQQFIHQGVRFNRATITWALLNGTYIAAPRLVFRFSTRTIEVMSDLE